MDNKLTKDMQEWLAKDSHSEQEIQAGARMVLQLNGQRFFYERMLRQPNRKKAEDNIRYELDKFLRIRLAGKTNAEVKRMMVEDIPMVDATLAEGAPETDEAVADEDAAATDEDDSSAVKKAESRRKGKRPDHDQLPDEIKQLWEDNAERYKKLAATRATLAEMVNPEPCDAFEYCQMCVELHEEYRRDMKKYDDYVAEVVPEKETTEEETQEELPEDTTQG